MKYSKQREIIYNTLTSSAMHVSADELHTALKEQGHNIGIATVYRNLNSLVESGHLIKFKSDDKTDRYDITLKPHHHITCEKCGKIFDLPIELTENLNKNIEQIGFELTNYTLILNGICNNCKMKEKSYGT